MRQRNFAVSTSASIGISRKGRKPVFRWLLAAASAALVDSTRGPVSPPRAKFDKLRALETFLKLSKEVLVPLRDDRGRARPPRARRRQPPPARAAPNTVGRSKPCSRATGR